MDLFLKSVYGSDCMFIVIFRKSRSFHETLYQVPLLYWSATPDRLVPGQLSDFTPVRGVTKVGRHWSTPSRHHLNAPPKRKQVRIRSFLSGYLPSRRQEYRSNLPATTINRVNLKWKKKSQNHDVWIETLPHSVPLSFKMEDETDSTWKISQQAEEEAFFNSEGSKRLIFNWFSGISWHASSCPIKAGLDSHQRLDPSVWSYVNKMTRGNRTSHWNTTNLACN